MSRVIIGIAVHLKTKTKTKIKTKTKTEFLKDQKYAMFVKSREFKDIKYDILTIADQTGYTIFQFTLVELRSCFKLAAQLVQISQS